MSKESLSFKSKRLSWLAKRIVNRLLIDPQLLINPGNFGDVYDPRTDSRIKLKVTTTQESKALNKDALGIYYYAFGFIYMLCHNSYTFVRYVAVHREADGLLFGTVYKGSEQIMMKEEVCSRLGLE